jgi:hypothetical protein
MHPSPEDLFERRMVSLERFVDAPTVIGAYDVAAPLRQLLLDATPLIDVVNRSLKVPLLFEVSTLPDEVTHNLVEEQRVILSGTALWPRFASTRSPTRRLKRDAFLKEPVVFTAWHRVTVGDMILWVANEAGAVHFAPKPGSRTTTLLNSLIRAIDSESRPIFGNTMLAIARVVLAAASPIRSALATSSHPE